MYQAHASILLPFRNAQATLHACLQSIAHQTDKDYELILVDDHSTDNSPAIAQEYAAADNRVRLLDNPDKGLVSALNHGLRHCRAGLVVRMDADDLMWPERLAAHREHFRCNPELVLSATQVRLFPEQDIQQGFREYIRWQNSCLSSRDITEDIYVESPFAHPSVAFRREIISGEGGYRQGLFPEDYDLWLRLYQAGHLMEKIPRVLLDWRDSPDRTSRTDPRCTREAFDLLRAAFLCRDPLFLQHAGNFVIWGAGRKTRRRCDHLLAQGFKPRAWIDIDPRKIGNRINHIPVHGADWLLQEDRPFVLSYVANHGARTLISEELESYGYRRGVDFLAVG